MINTPIRSRASLLRTGVLVGIAALTLAACGQGLTNTPNSSATRRAAGGGGGDGGGAPTGAAPEAGGGEAPAVRYLNARFHYRVDAPGTMQEAADGSASARRGTERLSVRVLTGAATGDLRAFATADLKQVQAASPKYHLVQALGSVNIGGHASLKVVYSWTDGTNAVTGKPEDLVTARYYIPRDSSTVAVMSYAIASGQYDPQGADDVASTFAWS